MGFSATDVILPLLNISGVPQMASIVLLVFSGGMIYSIVKYKFLMVTPEIAADNIISTMDELLILSDNKGKIISTNLAVKETLNYEQKELAEQHFEMLFKQDYFKIELIERILKGELIKNLETSFYSKKSVEIPVLLSCSPLKDPEGEIRGIVLIARDISERKVIETQLIESQSFLSEVIENNGAIIFVKDCDGRYNLVNKKWEEVLRIKREDTIGKKDVELFSNNYGESFRKTDLQVIESGKTIEKEEVLEDETGKRYFISIKFPLYNKEKQIKGVCGISTEITERKKAEEAVIQITKDWEDSFDSITDMITIHDKNYNIIRANHASKIVLNLLDINRQKELKCFKIFHGIDEPPLDCPSCDCVKNGKLGVFEVFEPIQKRYFEIRVVPRLDDNKEIVGIIHILRDITERKQIESDLIKAKEKAEESDRLKSAFLANISHEIRTPMNGILGFTGLLAEPNLSGEKQKEYIKIIEVSGIRLLNIINDIVDISKIESGQTEVNISDTNINEQVEFIYDFFNPEVTQKGLQFSYAMPLISEESIIKTDKEKVYAILTNLVKNAIKFTDQGSIQIGYTKRLLNNNDKSFELEFFVKDTGAGVNNKQMKIIFERFRQGSESYSRNYEGAGLGLSISKAYVEMLGGKIWLESELGVGSTFYFTIKTETGMINRTKIIEEKVIAEYSIQKSNFLIVDDNEASQLLFSKMISDQSEKVFFANNGKSAVEIVKNNPDIEVILMDIKMPEMNGLEATRQIRQFNKEVIIIAQSAYTFSDEIKNAIDAGCNDFTTKPVRKNILLDLINKHQKIKRT